MNEKIKLLKNEIDSFLTKHKKFSSFKIGKTGNLDYRRKEYYELGFQFVWEIATGEAQIITNTEKGLIKYFTNESPHKYKCLNEQEGGGSNNATILYIAIKAENLDINDLHDDTFPISDNLPINLNK